MDEALIKRVLPHSVEAEQSVIGSMLMDREAIIAASEIITGADFYQHQYGVMFESMVELFNEGKPVDLVTLQNRLREKDVPPEVSSLDFVRDIMTSVPTSVNVKSYANIVREKAVLRRLIKVNEEIENLCYGGRDKLEDILAHTEKSVFDLLQSRGGGEFVPIRQVALNVLEKIEAASKSNSTVTGIPTGFIDLDYRTSGFQPSDFILIAARPSMGKTAFVLSMARNMAVDHEQGVAFFSLEMSSVQLMMRLIIAETGLSGNDVKSGRLTPEQWRHLESATKPLGSAPLFIDDTPALSVFEFRSKARRLKIHNDIKIIIIDYLQLMTGNQDTKGNREQEVAFISRTLKAIAKELNVPVIALSQLSRATEMRGGSKRPQLSDLRESGAIEQDADIVAFIHRPEYYGINQDENGMPTAGMAEIILAKHRNGAVCDVNLRFLKEQARFADMEDSMLPPAQAADSQQAYDDYASGSNGMPAAGLGAAMGGEFDVNRSANLNDEAPF